MGLGPFDLTGGPFLILYIALLIAALIAGFVIPVRLRPPGRRQAVTDPDALAWLAGGRARFVEAMVARLLATGALKLLGKEGFVPVPGRTGATAAEQRVLALSAPIKWTTILLQTKDYAEPVERKLASAGLLMSDEERATSRFWATLPYVLLIGFGTIKLMVGEARHKPVGFLTVLLILTAVMAAVRWFTVERRTQAARDALTEANRRNERLKIAPTTDEMGIAVALFGTTVLAGSAWDDFHRMRAAGDASSGSSDSGSSDGGSGCGGGGCGGCGG